MIDATRSKAWASSPCALPTRAPPYQPVRSIVTDSAFVSGQGGKVVDKRTLATIFVSLSSVLFTVATVILALRGDQIPRKDQMCALSAAEIDMVQSVMQTRPPNCTYNISFDNVLAM